LNRAISDIRFRLYRIRSIHKNAAGISCFTLTKSNLKDSTPRRLVFHYSVFKYQMQVRNGPQLANHPVQIILEMKITW
jgi:hypothetical protein